MKPQLILQIDPSLEYDREVIERIVSSSFGKIDSYLKRYESKPDAVVRIEFFLRKNVDGSFFGKLHGNFDGQIVLFEREKFIKLDDLINHAFQHTKEQLAAK